MKHVIRIRATFSAKNKALETIGTFVIKFNHILLDDDELKTFLNKINEAIKEVNNRYPRCRDIQLKKAREYRDIPSSSNPTIYYVQTVDDGVNNPSVVVFDVIHVEDKDWQTITL